MARTFGVGKRLWDESTWDEGWPSADGYFMVFRPDHPNCPSTGMMKRHQVVWWLRTGDPPPDGSVLHHINHDSSDDRFENLQVMTRAEHAAHHNPVQRFTTICAECGAETAECRSWASRRRFCSHACAKRFRWKATTETKPCGFCGKPYTNYKFRRSKYCGADCYHKSTKKEHRRNRDG